MPDRQSICHGKRFKDLTGKVFGRLTVIQETGRRGLEVLWRCVCMCGREHVTTGAVLRNGDCRSCGCLNRETATKRAFRHGGCGTPEYAIYHGILKRCYDQRATGYENYGGRGVVMCPQWLGPNGFVNFLADMGPKPTPAHTVERTKNDGWYGPGNCVWATYTHQARNKRNNRLLTFEGRTMPLAAWAEEKQMRPNTILMRLSRGWTVEDAISVPVSSIPFQRA